VITEIGQPSNRTIKVNEIRLHYLEWRGGGDKTILLLHGFMGHAHVWDALASDLSNYYRVLALDQRGHGESDWSKKVSYSIDSHYADLRIFIKSLDLQKIILLGHSMGGRNALFYAACVPEKVEGLIVVDARLRNNPESSKALQRQIVSLPLQTKNLGEVDEALLRLYPYLSIETCRYIAKHGYIKSRDGRYVAKYDDRMSVQIKRADYKTDNLWHMARNVTCPTLFVRGKESPFVSAEEVKRMCLAIKGAKFQEIVGATHMPVQENPKAFKEVIKNFLKIK
jgi:pimeloyl-ACP methyl ester carboxylesterase